LEGVKEVINLHLILLLLSLTNKTIKEATTTIVIILIIECNIGEEVKEEWMIKMNEIEVLISHTHSLTMKEKISKGQIEAKIIEGGSLIKTIEIDLPIEGRHPTDMSLLFGNISHLKSKWRHQDLLILMQNKTCKPREIT
jgi:hypothetical protein